MNSRIRKLRNALNLSQKEFGKMLKLEQATISTMEKDGKTVTEKNIKAICTLFHVNEDWLRTGNGPMFLENDRKRAALLENFERLSPALKDFLIITAKNLLDIQMKLQNADETSEQGAD